MWQAVSAVSLPHPRKCSYSDMSVMILLLLLSYSYSLISHYSLPSYIILFLIIPISYYLVVFFCLGRAGMAVYVRNVRLNNRTDSVFPHECGEHAASCRSGAGNVLCCCHDMVSHRRERGRRGERERRGE